MRLRRGNGWRQPRRGRSVVVLLLLLLLWSICLGWGLAQATETPAVKSIPPLGNSEAIAQSTTPSAAPASAKVGTVDVVPDRYQAGKKLYLENCATCHIGLPPEIMPSETWRQLLQDPQHYGADLRPLVSPNLQIVWEYVKTFSRPQSVEEEIPYRIYQSRYFKILHPKVKLPARAGINSCASCHPGAGQYDFRTLSSEWQNAP